MPGYHSTKVIRPSPVAAAQADARNSPSCLDLTNGNLTLYAVQFPLEKLTSLVCEYLANRRYTPDPRGSSEVRQALHDYYSSRDAAVSDFYLTASSSESYRLLFSLLCEPGETIAVPTPGYPLVEYIAEDLRLKIVTYDLAPPETSHGNGEDGRGRWRVCSESMHNLNGVSVISLVSPHNPTGWVLRSTIPEIASSGVPLIVDEVFSELIWDDPGPPFPGALFESNPVFILNGISKMLALPDLKLGWIALNARAKALAGERLELLNDCYLSCNGLSLALLPALLDERSAFTTHLRASLLEQRNSVGVVLAESLHIKPILPEAGYYVPLRVLPRTDDERLAIYLAHNRIIVHPGYLFGLPESYLVVSMLTPREQLASGLVELSRLVDCYFGNSASQ